MCYHSWLIKIKGKFELIFFYEDDQEEKDEKRLVLSNFKDVGAKRIEIWWGELFKIFVLIWLFYSIFEPMYVQFCWSMESNDDFVVFFGQNCVCSMDLYGV